MGALYPRSLTPIGTIPRHSDRAEKAYRRCGEIRSARVALAATALPQSRFYLPAADGAVQPL